MLTRRGNGELNVTGTNKVSGNSNNVQHIMEIFVGGCDINSNEQGIQQQCTSIVVELKKLEHLNTKCEWYKAYKISMKAGDRKNEEGKIAQVIKSWPQ